MTTPLATQSPCCAAADTALDVDEPFLYGSVIPQDLKAANDLLASLGYPLYNRRKILPVLARQGTAQCVEGIAEGDRDAVEAVLAGLPPHRWAAWTDAERYELGPEPDEPPVLSPLLSLNSPTID